MGRWRGLAGRLVLVTAIAAPAGCLTLVGLQDDYAVADGCPGPECCASEDCPEPEAPCLASRCNAGRCEHEVTRGGISPSQIPGDCAVLVCDDHGEPTAYYNAGDAPDGGDPCLISFCSEDAGVLTTPAEAGTPCAHDAGSSCNGAGSCVEM